MTFSLECTGKSAQCGVMPPHSKTYGVEPPLSQKTQSRLRTPYSGVMPPHSK